MLRKRGSADYFRAPEIAACRAGRLKFDAPEKGVGGLFPGPGNRSMPCGTAKIRCSGRGGRRPAQYFSDLADSTPPRSQHDFVIPLSPRKLGPVQNHPDLADSKPPRSQHDFVILLLFPRGPGPVQNRPDSRPGRPPGPQHDVVILLFPGGPGPTQSFYRIKSWALVVVCSSMLKVCSRYAQGGSLSIP